MSMAKQYPEVLGIRGNQAGYMIADPTGETTNLSYIERTLRHMRGSAKNKTATVSVESVQINGNVLNARVRVVSGVAHKFPSGVGFRRAFVEFRVLDAQGKTLW